MATVLDDIGIVVNSDLAKMEKSKSIKTKPKTFTGTKNYFLDNLSKILNKSEEVEEKVQLTDDERVLLTQKIEKLGKMETSFTEPQFAGKVQFKENKPIKVKPAMYENITKYYGNYQLSQLVQEENEEVVEAVPEVQEVQAVQDKVIEEMLQNVRSENKPVIPSKSLEQIQNEEISKLMQLMRTKSILENSKSLEQIQDEEVRKIIEQSKPLRDEIQIVPERSEEIQKVIDNEFANQEVTMISSEEVEQTVNPDNKVDAPAKVSKYNQKEINMEKEETIRKIENSISEALNRIKQQEESKSIEDIFAEIYEQNKEEVTDKFDKIEEQTGKSVEDIFAEIYLNNRRSVEDIFNDLYGDQTITDKEDKSIEDYFAEVSTKTGKNVEDIFADIYDQEDRKTEEVFNQLYKDNPNDKSIEDIFQAIYSQQKQKTGEIFDSFEEATGNSIEEIFADIYGETGKSVDQIFNEIYNTPEGKTNKSMEDRFTELRISEGKNVDQVFQDVYDNNKESVEDIFNEVYNPTQIINNMVQNKQEKSNIIEFKPIKDKISFEEIFTRASDEHKENEIHFDYSRATHKDLNKAVESTSSKSELSEILRIVREKQNEKNELLKEIQLAKEAKSNAVQQKQKADQELLDRKLRKEEAERKVEMYLRQLEEENKEDMNRLKNYNEDSENLHQQAEDLLQQAEEEQNKIDEIYETIGQVSLRSAA